MGFVYILKLKDNSYYIGSCRQIDQRLKNHKSGSVISTKYKLPFEVIYTREYLTYSEARKEEIRIKNWKKRKLIENLCKFDMQNKASSYAAFV